jgi:hypothetical protein
VHSGVSARKLLRRLSWDGFVERVVEQFRLLEMTQTIVDAAVDVDDFGVSA